MALLKQAPQNNPGLLGRLQAAGLGDLLTGTGVGLLSQQPSQYPVSPWGGLAQGFQYANQMGQQRRENAQQDQILGFRQQQADIQQQQFAAEQEQTRKQEAALAEAKASRERIRAGLAPNQQQLFDLDPEKYAEAYIGQQIPKAQGPNSSVAKAAADLEAGLIDKSTYDRIVQKETYITPHDGPVTWTTEMIDGVPTQVSSTGERKAVPGQDNPLGNSYDANSVNVLVNGDPASPLYAAVYHEMSQPRVQYNPATGESVTITPNMSVYRAPGAPQAGASPQPTGGTPPMAAQAQPFTPQQVTQQGQTTPQSPAGVTVEQTTVPGLDKTAKAKVTDARVDAKSIIKSLDDYSTAFDNASLGERGKSLAGVGTELNTKYNIAALLSKAESLFNLGVLNGPDLDIIRRTVTDPSTGASIFTGSNDVKAQVKAVKELVKQRLNEREKEYGLPVTGFEETAPAVVTPPALQAPTRVPSNQLKPEDGWIDG